MKNGRKWIAIWLTALLGLTGCGLFTPKPTAVTLSASPSSSAPEATDAKTVIVYARGIDETEGTAKLIEAYNAQSSTVIVRYQELASDAGRRHQALYTSLGAQVADIDVFDADIVWPAEFAARGFVLAVDPFVSRDRIAMNAYLPGMVRAATYRNTLWGMPKNASAGVLYYRTDLLDAPPRTWDDLLEQAAVENMKYGFVFNGETDEGIICAALEFIYAYGGRILDDDGNIVVQNEKTIAGLNKFLEVYTADITPPNIAEMTDTEASIAFLQGESTMMRNWPHAWVVGGKFVGDARVPFAIAPLPAGDTRAAAVLGGSVMMINSKTRNAAAAWDFIRFATGPEGQAILAIYGGRVPALRSVMQNAAVRESNPHFGETDFVRAIENAVPRIVTPHYQTFSIVMQEELRKFLLLEQDAETTAANMEERIGPVLTVHETDD